MIRGRMFQYTVLYHPDPADKKVEDKKSSVLVELTSALAASEKEVALLAARRIPEGYDDKMDRMEVIIRPF